MEKLEKENGMEKLMLETLMEQQREYFASGATLPVKVRMEALSRLEKALQKQEQILCKALHTDLGKSKTESVIDVYKRQGRGWIYKYALPHFGYWYWHE